MKCVLILIAGLCILKDSKSADVQLEATLSIGKDALDFIDQMFDDGTLRTKTRESLYSLLNRFDHDKKQKEKEKRQTAKPPPPQMPMPPRKWMEDAEMVETYVMKKLNKFLDRINLKNITKGDMRPARVIQLMRDNYHRYFFYMKRDLQKSLDLDYYFIAFEWLKYVEKADQLYHNFGQNYIHHFLSITPIRDKGKWSIVHHFGAVMPWYWLRNKEKNIISDLMCRDFKVCHNYKFSSEYFMDWLDLLKNSSDGEIQVFVKAFVKNLKKAAKVLLKKETFTVTNEYITALQSLDSEVLKSVCLVTYNAIGDRHKEIENIDNGTKTFRRILLVLSKAYLYNEKDLVDTSNNLRMWLNGSNPDIKKILKSEATKSASFYSKWNKRDTFLFENYLNYFFKYSLSDEFEKKKVNKILRFSSYEENYSTATEDDE